MLILLTKLNRSEVVCCEYLILNDEIVFEIPDEHVEGWTNAIQDTMNTCAEHFMGPFGVKAECSPAIGQVWVKD